MDLQKVKDKARKELKYEAFRRAVDLEKVKMKNKKSFWDRIFPWRIVFIRK